jgi:hypothetical protein
MDIEGAEYLALRGAMKTLNCMRKITLIISAEHNPATAIKCLRLLKSLGFRVMMKGYMIYAERFL